MQHKELVCLIDKIPKNKCVAVHELCTLAGHVLCAVVALYSSFIHDQEDEVAEIRREQQLHLPPDLDYSRCVTHRSQLTSLPVHDKLRVFHFTGLLLTC